MRVLILAASGMLGHSLLYALKKSHGMDVHGTVRSKEPLIGIMPASIIDTLVAGVDAYDMKTVEKAMRDVQPDVVINCIGIVRQQAEGHMRLPCIELNARLPHLLHGLCKEYGCRLIHVSTDCVFDGRKEGLYSEDDPFTAKDVYGITKYLGELHEAPAVTIRTSIIGHELRNKLSLVEWFLAQQGEVKGYAKAIYSGLTTCELANVIARYILPNPQLKGLYQVASDPISKLDLLRLVAEIYEKRITIVPDSEVDDNKAMSCAHFREATGYKSPSWPDQIRVMREFNIAYIKDLS